LSAPAQSQVQPNRYSEKAVPVFGLESDREAGGLEILGDGLGDALRIGHVRAHHVGRVFEDDVLLGGSQVRSRQIGLGLGDVVAGQRLGLEALG
jgi:hypothetical protein